MRRCEKGDGTPGPKPQMVDRWAAIAGNQLIETDGVDVLGIDPSMQIARG